jgi:hypothetical protein
LRLALDDRLLEGPERPDLVLQPHLLFASLVVCAAGPSLVAAPPS